MKSFDADLIEKFGPAALGRIRNTRIGIAGAGGLGSNCAACLVRTGFRKLVIVDYDNVEPSNLDRQFYFADQVGMPKVEALRRNLLRINSDLELDIRQTKIECNLVEELFAECDIVAECMDAAEYKSMLAEAVLSMGLPLVGASGLGGAGSSDDIKVHRISNNFFIVGDLVSDIAQKPALAPRVNICAAKQADVILEYIILPIS